MDRTGKIAVAIAILVMVGWVVYQSKIQPPPSPAGASPSPSPAVASSGTGASPQPSPSASPGEAKPATPAPTPEPVVAEQTVDIPAPPKQPNVIFTFTNHGGGIARAELTNHLVDDGGKHIVLNDYGVVPIGATSDKPEEGMDSSYSVVSADAGGITYRRTGSDQLQITKKYTLPAAGPEGPDNYIATLDLTFTNTGAQPYSGKGYYIALGTAAPIHQHDMARYISMDWYHAGSAKVINVMSSFNASKILGIQWSSEKTENLVTSDSITWAPCITNILQRSSLPPAPAARPASRRGRIVSPWMSPPTSPAPPGASDTPTPPPPGYAINGALGMPGFDLKARRQPLAAIQNLRGAAPVPAPQAPRWRPGRNPPHGLLRSREQNTAPAPHLDAKGGPQLRRGHHRPHHLHQARDVAAPESLHEVDEENAGA